MCYALWVLRIAGAAVFNRRFIYGKLKISPPEK